MISGPAWDKDDRPGVKTMAKICPDCEVFDAQFSDPRKGMRHTSDFGLHYRSQDGLQPYCRHHMKQRRRHERTTAAPNSAGRLSAAGIRALQPAEPTAEDSSSNGHEPETPSDPSGATSADDVLLESFAGLEKSVNTQQKTLQALAERVGRLEGGAELRAVEEGLDARLTALEDARTAPEPPGSGAVVSRLQAALQALAGRVASLERAEKDEDGAPAGSAHESVNTRSLRRWTKQLGKEVANLATRVERVESKAGEAVRMAQAAARVNAGRPAEGAPAPNLEVLKAEILSAVQSQPFPALEATVAERLQGVLDSDLKNAVQRVQRDLQAEIDDRMAERPHAATVPASQKEVMMTQIATPPAPPIVYDGSGPDAVRNAVLDVLARYTAGLRNVAQIERDGLLDPADVSLIAERIQQRSADELCTYIGDLCRQMTSEEKR